MISIENIDKNNFHLVNSIEVSFLVTHKLLIKLTKEDSIDYDIKEIDSPYIKSYQHYSDAKEYLIDDNYHGYLAFIDKNFAGQILLQKYWNNLGSVEDLRVAPDFQRQGVGAELLNSAKSWVLHNKLKGLRLETQDANTRACFLYKKSGFVLSGFDFNLYAGMDSKNEKALYWYWLNPANSDNI